MSPNFSIESKRHGKDIHLRLIGDFDGASALELIFFMNRCFSNNEKVFINTDFLCLIEPFGINVFRHNISSFISSGNRFEFTGEIASVFQECCWQSQVYSDFDTRNGNPSFKDNSLLIH